MDSAFADPRIWWVVALALGIPVLLVVITEAISVATRRGSALAGPLKLLRNGVIPAGALLALLAFAVQSDAAQVWVRVVATIFGFLALLLVLSAFNVLLFERARTGTWRQRVPTIFVEIARLVLVVLGLGLLFSWVWGTDVGGLFTALGVGSLVIGLALQNAVGGVISGLLLLFEQPFKMGDWLDVGGVRGRVVEVNWRAVHIDTGGGIQVVPNATLAGSAFTNLTEPDGPFAASTTLTFSTDDPPHEVLALIRRVAEALPGRAPDSQVSVSYSGAATFDVSIPVNGPSDASRALSTFRAWLWYASRRAGLALDGDDSDPMAEAERISAAVAQVAPALHLPEEDAETLRADASLQRYGIGETVLPAGIVPDHVSFVVSGSASLALEEDGDRYEFAVAEPYDIIGHTALTRQPSQAVTVAQEVLTVLVIPLETFDALIRSRPRLAAEISDALDLKRSQTEEMLRERGIDRSLAAER